MSTCRTLHCHMFNTHIIGHLEQLCSLQHGFLECQLKHLKKKHSDHKPLTHACSAHKCSSDILRRRGTYYLSLRCPKIILHCQTLPNSFLLPTNVFHLHSGINWNRIYTYLEPALGELLLLAMDFVLQPQAYRQALSLQADSLQLNDTTLALAASTVRISIRTHGS